MHIVFLDSDTFTPNFTFKQPSFAHQWTAYPHTSPEQVASRIDNADVVITNKVVLDKALIENAKQLKLIAVAATGYNHIDVNTCKIANITVCNAAGYSINSVPEHALMLMLMLRRNIQAYQKKILAGHWQNSEQFCFLDYSIKDLHDTTLGIIGAGSLGMSVAHIAKGFGMKVIYTSHTPRKDKDWVHLETIYQQADIISLHCPLNDNTHDLINADAFNAMQKKPLIINTARGGIVNEKDAATALQAGQISGLGIDCLAQEPPIDGSPLLDIAHLENVIITPHIAWASVDAMNKLWGIVIDNIEGFTQGNIQNQVT